VVVLGAQLGAERFSNDVDGHTALTAGLQAAGLAMAVINLAWRATSPKPPASSPRPTASMRRCWRSSRRCCRGGLTPIGTSRALPEPAQQDLVALVTRRRPLAAMLLSVRQRMRLARPVARASIEATIEFLRRQRDDVEANTATHVQAHHAELYQLLRSAGGISQIASATLIAELPEFRRLNRGAPSARWSAWLTPRIPVPPADEDAWPAGASRCGARCTWPRSPQLVITRQSMPSILA